MKKFQDEELVPLQDYSNEVTRYKKVLENNNINGLSYDDICISVKHFETYNINEDILFLKDILILLFIATKTVYSENQFKFEIMGERDKVFVNVRYDSVSDFNLSNIYNWITESNDNIDTKLRVIRELIVRKRSFVSANDDLDTAKSIFNRIIKEETSKYFEQVSALKSDFISMSRDISKSYRTLHTRFLAWASAITIFIYNQILEWDFNSYNIVTAILLSDSERTLFFLSIFTISIIVIWILFNIEMYNSTKEYEQIKKIYSKNLFFDSSDFKNYISVPKINVVYKYVFCSLLTILVIRFIIVI